MYKYSVKICIIPFLEVILLAIGILAWGLQMFGSEEQICEERELGQEVCAAMSA